MGKVVILGGNARSGKTTLALELVKNGYSRISLDNLQGYIEDGLGINFDDYSYNMRFNFFKTIVNSALDESKNENTNLVIDMYDYLPSELEKIEGIDKENVYYLIYPNCTKEEIKYNVIHYAKPTDWIAQVNEEYLNECVERFYDRNNLILNQCTKYNYQYIDTSSGEERNKVLTMLLNKITNDNN